MAKALAVLLFVVALASPQSSMKEVAYQVDGTSKYVNLTLRNKDGGAEQNNVFGFHFDSTLLDLVDLVGFEPTTSSMPWKISPVIYASLHSKQRT
jgi:hypothetical protein